MKKIILITCTFLLFTSLTSCKEKKQTNFPNHERVSDQMNLLSGGVLDNQAWWYMNDAPYSTRGLIQSYYGFDDGTNIFKNVVYLDTTYMQAIFWSSIIPSVNTDSRVLTADATGMVHLRDVSSISGSVSTPTALAAGSRVINTSTISPTSYTVSARSRFIFSATATASITVLGNVTGTVYLETSQSGSSAWVYRGNVAKVYGSLLGLTTGNGSSINVELYPGDRYRFMASTSSTGIGNGASYIFDGGSYQLVQ